MPEPALEPHGNVEGELLTLAHLGLAYRLVEHDILKGRTRTPDFLAPEQARNPMAVDIRADIYALGATLYWMISGRKPVEAPARMTADDPLRPAAEASKLISLAERAKKQHNNKTEPLLDQHDDAITKALAVANQAI